MKVNSTQPFTLYNTQKASSQNIRPQKTEQAQQAKRSAGKSAKTGDVKRQKEVAEFRKLLSTEERKMFDLLFPADSKPETKPALSKSERLENRYTMTKRPVRQKMLGNRLDIRG